MFEVTEALPDVVEAAFVSRLPGFNHPMEGIQLESDTTRSYGVRVVAVDAGHFDIVDARVIAGRAFRSGDFTADTRLAIVDATWAGRSGERVHGF